MWDVCGPFWGVVEGGGVPHPPPQGGGDGGVPIVNSKGRAQSPGSGPAEVKVFPAFPPKFELSTTI